MRVYVNRTLPCFSYIVLVACLGKVGHSAGAPLGTCVLNGKGLNIIPLHHKSLKLSTRTKIQND